MVCDRRREDPADHGVIARSVPSARHRQRFVDALGQAGRARRRRPTGYRKLRASPLPSTATQTVGEGHETDVSDALGSTVWDDQPEPFHSEAAPELLTAMQKAELTHETPVRSTTPALAPFVDRPGAGTCMGPLQTVPFQVSA